MIEIESIDALRAWRAEQRRADRRVGLVPTMGFLHEGHLRLVDEARAHADAVVLSVFVNPAQFGPNEDFDRYPRDMERDRRLAAGRSVDCLFAPGGAEIYPEPAVIRISPGALGSHLCGARRPGHFDGVLLVVLKLFHIVEPEMAVFGRKDAQQALILQRMVRDLNVPVHVVVAPTTREADGLAMSSRNANLAPAERAAAAIIPKALDAGHRAFATGTTDSAAITGTVRDALADEPLLALEYVEIVDPNSLAPTEKAASDSLLALAVRAGGTRLVDNVPLGTGLAADVLAGD